MSDTTQVAGIIDNIRRIFQVYNDYSKRAERETGLTGPQLWAIKVIAQNSPLMVSDLARLMFVHPATVVGIIDRLEKRGLVSRARSQEDRRVVKLELTPQGKELVAQAPEVVQGHLVNGLESLPAAELEPIAEGLEKLVRILGAQEVPPNLILLRGGGRPPKGKRGSSPPNEE